MLKKENVVWLYFIGIIVMLIIVAWAGRDYFIPIFLGDRGTNIQTGFVYEDPPEMNINTDLDYRAIIDTFAGNITVDLFETAAPLNVNNFVFLSNNGYYRGTTFHRLVPDFFIQGGDRNTLNDDPSDDGFGGPGYIVRDEINWDTLGLDDETRNQLIAGGYSSEEGLFSRPIRKYSVVMANSGPDTNGSQFFIVIAEDDDPRLDEMQGKYTVIGEVIFGKDILLNIADTDVDATNPLIPRPIRRLTIQNINITSQVR